MFSILNHAVPMCIYTVETSQQQSQGRKDSPRPRCLSWHPQPGTHALVLPQPPKVLLKIRLPKCNLTTWRQSRSEISSGLSEVFTFACAKRAPGNITARGRRGITGTGEPFRKRTRSPGLCPRQCMAQRELLCAHKFTQPHWEPNLQQAPGIYWLPRNVCSSTKGSAKSPENRSRLFTALPRHQYGLSPYSQHFYSDSRNLQAISGSPQAAEWLDFFFFLSSS